MASRQGDLAGIFQQRKPSASKSEKAGLARKGKREIDTPFSHRVEDGTAVSLGSGAAQPAALTTARGGRKDLNEEHDEVEEALRQFDMNMAYGPCLGVTRMERWERAKRLGLNPPQQIHHLLEEVGCSPSCLWEGRV